jgi:hypothetical protein
LAEALDPADLAEIVRGRLRASSSPTRRGLAATPERAELLESIEEIQGL